VGAIAEEGDWQVQYLWWNSETQSNWLDGYVRTAILLKDKIQLQNQIKTLRQTEVSRVINQVKKGTPSS
jgi:hypothetical protein